jgi:hypothetical protein
MLPNAWPLPDGVNRPHRGVHEESDREPTTIAAFDLTPLSGDPRVAADAIWLSRRTLATISNRPGVEIHAGPVA